MLYKLWGRGEGPRFFMVGNVFARITPKAEIEWQRSMEAATASNDGGR